MEFAGCRMAAGIFFARSGACRLHFGRTARIITHIFCSAICGLFCIQGGVLCVYLIFSGP